MLLTIYSCDKKKDDLNNNCGSVATIDSELYQNGTSDLVSIYNAIYQEGCLKITISASGCSGDSWEVSLIDSGEIDESLPPQRHLRLLLKNKELCLAFITKEFTFDIEGLSEDYDEVIFHLNGYENTINVNY